MLSNLARITRGSAPEIHPTASYGRCAPRRGLEPARQLQKEVRTYLEPGPTVRAALEQVGYGLQNPVFPVQSIATFVLNPNEGDMVEVTESELDALAPSAHWLLSFHYYDQDEAKVYLVWVADLCPWRQDIGYLRTLYSRPAFLVPDEFSRG